MDIATLDTIAESIAQVRSRRVAVEEKVKAARAALEEKMSDHLNALAAMDQEEEVLREKMAEALKETKKDTWQTEKVSVALGKSVTFKVLNQEETIAWIKEKGLEQEYVQPAIKSEFKGVMEQIYGQNETIPGVQKTTKDYVRVTDRKPKKEKEA